MILMSWLLLVMLGTADPGDAVFEREADPSKAAPKANPVWPRPTSADQPRIETSRAVFLEEAGQLDFKLVPGDLVGLPRESLQLKYVQVTFGFDKVGKIAICRANATDSEEALETAICNAVKARAKFDFVPGFILPNSIGYLEQSITLDFKTNLIRPVQFLPKGKGTEAVIFYSKWDDEGYCDAGSVNLSAEDQWALCSAFLATDVARTGKFSNGKPFDLKGNLVKFWVKTANDPELAIAMTISRQYVPGIPKYYSPLSPENWLDVSKIAAYVATIRSDDYPGRALQMEWQGRSKVRIGVDSRGFAMSCQPIETSGYSILDNAACARLLGKKYLQFVAGYKLGPKLHYLNQGVNWKIPQ